MNKIDPELLDAMENTDSVIQINMWDSFTNTYRVFTTRNYAEAFSQLIGTSFEWSKLVWEFCGSHLLIFLKK